MLKATVVFSLVCVLTIGCSSERGSVDGRLDTARFNGEWVLDAVDGVHEPMALEISGAGTDVLAGFLTGAAGGRTQPFLESQIVDGELRFMVERTFDGGRKVRADTTARIVGEGLRGSTTRNGRTWEWIGRRPDVIEDHDDGSWRDGDPVVLFGSDSHLSLWRDLDEGKDGEWRATDGVLHNIGSANTLATRETFWNFRLHVEYLLQENGNSGIGLRGRYEVQLYDDHEKPPSIHGNGALYSRITPQVNATKVPGEWQVFDITLIGRDLTVVLNGETLIDKGRVDGLTAMAIDSRESTPGPILLQGDHGPVEFRNIVITPLRQ